MNKNRILLRRIENLRLSVDSNNWSPNQSPLNHNVLKNKFFVKINFVFIFEIMCKFQIVPEYPGPLMMNHENFVLNGPRQIEIRGFPNLNRMTSTDYFSSPDRNSEISISICLIAFVTE
jgi:hypothetical protein